MADIISVVLADSEHDVKKEGIRAVGMEVFNKIGRAGGFIDHSLDVGNHPSPLDIKSLRTLRDDPKADKGRRQDAGARLQEIEAILAEGEPKKSLKTEGGQ